MFQIGLMKLCNCVTKLCIGLYHITYWNFWYGYPRFKSWVRHWRWWEEGIEGG